LRAIRRSRGLSLRELARRLDLSPSSISQIETGKMQPSVRTLYAFVSEFGVTVDEVLFDQAPAQGVSSAVAELSPTAAAAAGTLVAVAGGGRVHARATARELGTARDREHRRRHPPGIGGECQVERAGLDGRGLRRTRERAGGHERFDPPVRPRAGRRNPWQVGGHRLARLPRAGQWGCGLLRRFFCSWRPVDICGVRGPSCTGDPKWTSTSSAGAYQPQPFWLELIDTAGRSDK
jgi:transcriptional regulator with XRE-family HTH domain